MTKKKQLLFFDIETTGLNPEVSAITVIGCRTADGNVTQWFNEDGLSQKRILQEFLEFLTPDYKLVSFHGKSFDLPFLQSKIKEFGLSVPLNHWDHLDLYQTLKPFRHLFSERHFRQKDLENHLNIVRKDTLSGKKIIATYQSWLKTGDISYKEQLLLHNLEDLNGLNTIYSLLCYPSLMEGEFKVLSAAYEDHQFHASLSLKKTWPADTVFQTDQMILKISGTSASFSCMDQDQKLKHYHPDFKNYDYLPQEDLVIPKTMRSFVDSSSRQNATIECCYSKFSPGNSFLNDQHALYTFCKDNIYYLLRKK